jgi:hypothetical protein
MVSAVMSRSIQGMNGVVVNRIQGWDPYLTKPVLCVNKPGRRGICICADLGEFGFPDTVGAVRSALIST